MQNHNGGQNGNGFGPPPYNNIQPSPTPHRANVNNNNMGVMAEQGRYVPPQKRGGNAFEAESIIRPESSMSNVTFASQAPMQQFAPVNPAFVNRGQLAYPPAHHLPPGGHYAYGPAQLNQQFARFDASLGAARAAPGVQPYMNNGHGVSNGPNFYNGGVRPGFGGAAGGNGAGGYGHGVIGSGMRTNNDVAHTPHDDGSEGHDSAVANSKGHYLARMIMSGAADDPRDVDYGNPGPSRRPEAVYRALADSATPSATASRSRQRRGHVVAAAGQESNESSPHASVRAANIRGNPEVYIGTKQLRLPDWMQHMENGIYPSVQQVFHDLPLIEGCRCARPSTAGVIRIRNIPYNTSRAEIIAYLGRNAQIVNQPIGTPFMAVHIMMDRLSGKTMDAFIEVESPREAGLVATQFARRLKTTGRQTKLGDRPVVVEQSSQQDLMSELFPRAKTVTWVGPEPKFDTTNIEYFYPGVPSVGFEGFLFDEDYAHLVKHLEMPQRSPFVQRCMVRPYESLISTVHKFPWFAVDYVLFNERNELFKVVLKAIDALMQLLRKIGGNGGHDPTKPTTIVLKELVVAALVCPGFSEFQKSRVIRHLVQGNYGQYTTSKGLSLTFGGTDNYSGNWPFQILVKKPGVNDQLVEYIAGLLRDATTGNQLSLADIHAMNASGNLASPFGSIELDYTGVKTIADVGRVELRAIEKLLSLILPRGGNARALPYGFH